VLLFAASWWSNRVARCLRAALPALAVAAALLVVNAAAAVSVHGAVEGLERIALGVVVAMSFLAVAPRLTALLLGVAGTGAAIMAVWQRLFGLEAAAEWLRAPEAAALAGSTRAAMLARVESGRAFGTLLLPGSLAGLIGITLPATLALVLRLRGAARGAAIAGALVQAAAILATGSLAGIAALVLAGAATAVLAAPSARLRWSAAVGALAIGGACLIGVAAARGIGGGSGVKDAPFGWRAGNWTAGVRMIAERPVLGAGGDGYAALYPRLRAEGSNETRRAHCTPLELLVEYGLFALPMILLGAVAVLGLWLRACRAGGTAAILSIGLPAFLLHDLVDFTAYQPAVLLPFLALAGSLAARLGDEKEEDGTRVPPAPLRPVPACALVALGLWLAGRMLAGGAGDLMQDRAAERLAAGDREGALDLQERAAALSPKDPAPLAAAASTLIALGRAEDAAERAGRAARLEPESGALRFLEGSALLSAQKPVPAFVAFCEAVRPAPTEASYREARDRTAAAIAAGAGKEGA